MARLIALLLMSLGLSLPVLADEEAPAFDSGDVLNWLGDVGTRGSAEAQYVLVDMAIQGDPRAQYTLGKMYSEGIGVFRDPEQAVKWFRRAAAQGHVGALSSLQLMAEQDDAAASLALGELYRAGAGVEQDDFKALRHFRSAAAQEQPEALYALGRMHRLGAAVARDEIGAVALYRQAAERGMLAVGRALGGAHPVPPVPAEARQWFPAARERTLRVSASWGPDDISVAEAFAQYWIGFMYMTGGGVTRDVVRAATWHCLAATQQLDLAEYSLGALYAGGHGVPRDQERAYRWFDLAAAHGHKWAAERRDQMAAAMPSTAAGDARPVSCDEVGQAH